jgi:hypothetical protein
MTLSVVVAENPNYAPAQELSSNTIQGRKTIRIIYGKYHHDIELLQPVFLPFVRLRDWPFFGGVLW